MKRCIVIFMLMVVSVFSLRAQENKLQKSDIAMMCGSWEGTLTYLDYSSGKPYTMPANVVISTINASDHLLVQMMYPDEPNANSSDTLHVFGDGGRIDGEKVISRDVMADGTVKIVSEERGKDGNDNSSATFRFTRTISKVAYVVVKEVRFDGSEQWIVRHTYSYKRKS